MSLWKGNGNIMKLFTLIYLSIHQIKDFAIKITFLKDKTD